MGEINTPQRMDAVGEYLLYYESELNVHIVVGFKLVAEIITLST
jgi:hypothetical protein